MTIDREKIRQKLQFMRDNLRKLERFHGMNIEEFKSNFLYEAAATRMLQITIEAMLDICAHVIAREGWGIPKTYGETVEIAACNGLIPSEMEETYKNIAKFRNRVVHLYDDVKTEEIFNIIKSHLKDFKPFITKVIQAYFSENST